MASLLAILSSILWGTSDFEGGRLSKKHAPLAVLGFSQVLGLIFGIFLMLVSGAGDALVTSVCSVFMQDYQLDAWVLSHPLVPWAQLFR